MSLTFSVIRCAPRRRRWSFLKLALLLVASAALGWVLVQVKGGAL